MSYQYELLEKLSFNRYGGTDDEKRAAEIIADEVRKNGGEPVIEEFEVAAYNMYKASFKITKPFEKEIEVIGVGRSGSTPEGGVTAPFVYCEAAEEVDLRDVKGKIIMVNGTGYEAYKRMVNSGAIAFVVFSGKYHDDRTVTDIDKRMLRPLITENGVIPGVCMRAEDAMDIVFKGAAEAHIEVIQENVKNTSRNVTAFIKGSEFPEEEVVLTAHYDSIIYGNGSWDNASGSVNIMEMFRYYQKNPPKRSIRFIWCGSEEQGLLGSKAYVAAHPEEVEKMRLCVNFDMTGILLGRGQMFITGNDTLEKYAKAVADEVGYTARWIIGVHSSDSAPFAKAGVPGIGLAREGNATGHSRWDIIAPMSAQMLERATDYAKSLLDRALNAVIFPIERVVSPDMMDKLEAYFLYGKKVEKK